MCRDGCPATCGVGVYDILVAATGGGVRIEVPLLATVEVFGLVALLAVLFALAYVSFPREEVRA
ncbi:MAG: hypothetical protein WD638_02215 [Nitriliruptoraceae bacterium]